MKKIIHCIGDSHASFFSGFKEIQPSYPQKSFNIIPLFKAYRLGPVLAFNLKKNNTTSQGREKLFSLLKKIPKDEWILLCFGEIDCRVHIIKQHKKQNKPIEEIVDNCVKNYISVINEIKNLGYRKIIIWNVIPTSPKKESIEFPTTGNLQERLIATKLFNRKLKDFSTKNSLKFIYIFDNLINNNTIETKYYSDDVHLNQNVMPLTIKQILKKVNFKNVNLNHKKPKMFFILFTKNIYTIKKNIKKHLKALIIKK